MLGKLSSTQQSLLRKWLPGLTVDKDHSWGLVPTTVLEVTHAGARLIVKAGGVDDRHIAREIHAHRHWLGPWTSRGRAPVLVHSDVDAKLLVTTYLPGELVLGGQPAGEPDVFRQAGELLALLHNQTRVVDDGYERVENAKSLKLLDGAHRIAETTVERLRAVISAWPTPAVPVVPTHGDWQTRNWLIHEDVVSVIDFGRAAMRPSYTDFARLVVQEFRAGPSLEAAFLTGYGDDPRETSGWHRSQLREAVGTACWAYTVGSESFEAQGHRMIAEALRAFPA